jgi:hypothetical protein
VRSGRVEEWVMERGKRGKPGDPTAGRVALRRKGRKGLRWTSEHERGPNTEGEMGDGVSAVINYCMDDNKHCYYCSSSITIQCTCCIFDAVIIINTINHHQHHDRSRVPRGRIASGGLCCDRHNNVLCYSICYCRYVCTVLHSTLQWFISNILYTCSPHPIASSDPRDEMNTQPYLPPSAYPSAPSPPKNESTKHCKRQYYEEDEKA